MQNPPPSAGLPATLQKFETILAQETFCGLKAILDTLSSDCRQLFAAVTGTNSYEELLVRLGYRLSVTKQIHVQDCYQRIGPEGGIKSVLPYHDIPTHSSLPTLVNVDSTVTTTPKSAAFFNGLLISLKAQLKAQGVS